MTAYHFPSSPSAPGYSIHTFIYRMLGHRLTLHEHDWFFSERTDDLGGSIGIGALSKMMAGKDLACLTDWAGDKLIRKMAMVISPYSAFSELRMCSNFNIDESIKRERTEMAEILGNAH